MVCTQEVELPHASVAVQVREIVASSPHMPAATLSEKVTVGIPSQLSVAVATPVAAGALSASQSIVVSAGQNITGAESSTIEIVCAHEVEFPQASVAVQVRVITCSCAHTPPSAASENVTDGALSQLSVAVALPVLPGAVLAAHEIVTSAGQVRSGTVDSSTGENL